MTDREKECSVLYELLNDNFKDRLKKKSITPTEIGHLVRFLKDNNITADIRANPEAFKDILTSLESINDLDKLIQEDMYAIKPN